MERPLLENESLKDMAETEGGRRASGVSATGARDVADPEVAEKPKRRRFSAEYRLRIVREADACKEPGENGEAAPPPRQQKLDPLLAAGQA